MPDLPPVPDCEGPRLQPYRSQGTAAITFLDRIGNGAHGHVFKVQIYGKIFALKVFNYQILHPEWVTALEEEWHKIDVKLLTAQWHPFHAECRAYARLKEAGKEHLAVRCYGYLNLTDRQKRLLEDRFGIDTWWDEDYDLETPEEDMKLEYQREGRRCLRALVKDYIHSDVAFGPQHAPMMVENLHQLHRCGIVVHDLKEDAYVGGKLVDFSKAIVAPHILFSSPLRGNMDERARSEVLDDLAALYTRFEDWNEDHKEGPKILCNPIQMMDVVGKLRRGPLSRNEYIARCFNPRKVKWQKFSLRPGDSCCCGNKH